MKKIILLLLVFYCLFFSSKAQVNSLKPELVLPLASQTPAEIGTFSPDNKKFISGSGGIIEVWDVNTGEIDSYLKKTRFCNKGT
jgi:WD40 repeat protein